MVTTAYAAQYRRVRGRMATMTMSAGNLGEEAYCQYLIVCKNNDVAWRRNLQ